MVELTKNFPFQGAVVGFQDSGAQGGGFKKGGVKKFSRSYA